MTTDNTQLYTKVQRLTLWPEYGKKDQYRATVEFQGSMGKIELVLGDEMAKKILVMCADDIAAEVRRLTDITAEHVLGQAVIEHKPSE